MSRLSTLLAVISFLALLAGGSPAAVSARPGSPAVPASTAQHAAGVVVDTGSEVRRVCVRFSEDSISGEELLRRAKTDPVFSQQAQGTAVCALCGVGCPADDCFCESETSGRYWNYSTSSGSGWQRSNTGVHRRTIRHGDMDGWAWGGAGATPPPATFESICPPEASPSPSPSPTRSPSPSPTASPSPAGGAAASPTPQRAERPTPSPADEDDAAEVAAADEEPTATPEPTAEPTAEATEGPEADPTDEPVVEPTIEATEDSVLSVGDDAGGGALRSLAWFTAALAVVGGVVIWRRREVHPPDAE